MLLEHNQGACELAQYSTNCASMGGGGVTDMWRGWSYCSSAKLKRTVNFLFFTIKVLDKWHQLLLLRITNGIFTKMYCKSLKQAFQEEAYWLLSDSGGISLQRPLPLERDLLDRYPLEGTWNQAARQEVTWPPYGQTNTCENITLPQTLCAGGKNNEEKGEFKVLHTFCLVCLVVHDSRGQHSKTPNTQNNWR